MEKKYFFFEKNARFEVCFEEIHVMYPAVSFPKRSPSPSRLCSPHSLPVCKPRDGSMKALRSQEQKGWLRYRSTQTWRVSRICQRGYWDEGTHPLINLISVRGLQPGASVRGRMQGGEGEKSNDRDDLSKDLFYPFLPAHLNATKRREWARNCADRLYSNCPIKWNELLYIR